MTKNLVILGGGTAGTMLANKLVDELKGWKITVVERNDIHYYQPGFLFVPFGIYQPEDVYKPMRNLFDPRVNVMFADVDLIKPEVNEVKLRDSTTLNYDYLIIATGTNVDPTQTEGLFSDDWYQTMFDFYTFEGAVNLAQRLANFRHGRLVVNIVENPIKCPVAPLEFAFLADWYFTQKGVRQYIDIIYATPLPAAFDQPVAAAKLGSLLVEKNIIFQPNFHTARVDGLSGALTSWDDETIDFDLLATVPPNMGAQVIADSGMGDERRYVPTDPHTLQARDYENIFVIGDACDMPTTKAGSAAHFEADIVVENLLAHIQGRELTGWYDGHTNLFVETGFNKGIIIDFNYETEPLPGNFPHANFGPMTLLEESRMNHMGKMAFRMIYWNLLLKGREIPLVPREMSLDGKILRPD